MKTIFFKYCEIFNKLFSSESIIYFLLIINVIIILFLTFILNNFFKIILNFCFIVNNAIFLNFLNGDFFGAFLLVTEIPVILILIIFYFHKNSLDVDTLYNFKKFDINYSSLLVIFFFFWLLFKKDSYNFFFILWFFIKWFVFNNS